MFETRRLFDGGMGTLLQAEGLRGGERPETWNVSRPEVILDIHKAYLQAGARVVTTNTFGAARPHLGEEAEACMRAGVRLAKQARDAQGVDALVLCDMGSLGRLIAPCGDLPVEEAIGAFREAFTWALLEGADGILAETLTDLMEAKAAVIAAKEAMEACARRVPLFVSLTFDERGRLLTGADIAGTVAMLTALGVSAIGLNCGHEPKRIMENARTLLSFCELPVFIQPNASLPVVVDGKTTFPTDPATFAADMKEIAQLGAWGLGGCCGTTPAHIAALCDAVRDVPFDRPKVKHQTVLSGRTQTVAVGNAPVLIGERLNPTGKKKMKQALLSHDMDTLLREAIAQTDAGADALDVNVGLPELDEPTVLREVVQAVQSVCDCPLQLDTADPAALEASLRVYAGRPLINSVCGKQSVMDAVFPLAKKYGGALVALTLDEQGIPPTAEGRIQIAQRILAEADKHAFPREDLFFDTLTMTVATDENAANITLSALHALHEMGLKTVLGASNVSFGLPDRPLLTGAFLAMAVHAGLTAAIMNPCDLRVRDAWEAAAAIAGRDAGFARYLAERADRAPAVSTTVAPRQTLAPEEAQGDDADGLKRAITRGLMADSSAFATRALDGGAEPLSLIDTAILPALTDVGDRYERGALFLPQLLQSAEAARAAFDVLRARMPKKEGDGGAKMVLATVKGDVHDIGKNIVKVLLQNYGFQVIDLGKDVPPERVVQAAREHGAKLVGLSALMTTTVPAMRDTIALVHAELPGVRVIVGGAVLTRDYAQEIGADAYAKDAMDTVRQCQQWL